jgi:hypothetical protein
VAWPCGPHRDRSAASVATTARNQSSPLPLASGFVGTPLVRGTVAVGPRSLRASA